MSIYLTHNHKMLKADSARPGRYFGWIAGKQPRGLLYLTYFTKNFLYYPDDVDDPVVRDESIPLLRTQLNAGKYFAASNHINLDKVSDQLPESFKDYDAVKVYLRSGSEDTILCPWNLPFSSSDKWSFTWRAYYGTDGYVRVRYSEDDYDWYWVNPSVSLVGTNNYFGISDYDSERFPSKVMSTYKGSPTSTEPVGPTLCNGTVWTEFKDRYYDEPPHGWSAEYPPYGRVFYQYMNPNVSPVAGDQWYYNAIVGHGDGTVSLYVNGTRIMNVPFEEISYLQFYVGSKSFSDNASSVVNPPIPTKVTEVALWGKDISINSRNNVPLKSEPIYIKTPSGVYLPNGRY